MQTIATFSKPEEAHLLRMRLEAVGIRAFVQDENMVQLDWLLSNAIGGVRVQVRGEDLQEVREFLAMDAREALPVISDVECPRCGSNRTAGAEWPRRLAYFTILIFYTPLFFSRNRWCCADCGHDWKQEPRRPEGASAA